MRSTTSTNNYSAAVIDEFYNPLLYHNNVGKTSFNTILYRRMEGRIRSVAFHNIIKRQQQSLIIYNNNNVYIPDPSLRIFFPNNQKHNNSNNNNNTGQRSSIHTTLDVCNESRFLLCGNNHGMISIFDLSPWGKSNKSNSSGVVQNNRQQQQYDATLTTSSIPPNRSSSLSIHEPIQQAMIPTTTTNRYMTTASSTSSTGMSSVVSARWYPIDNGIFITASKNGSIHIWDTNEMISVMEMKPYQYENNQQQSSNNYRNLTSTTSASPLLSCMEPCSHVNGSNIIGVCSMQSNLIKLIDIRTGSSTHTLHNNHIYANSTTGITTLTWSPNNSFTLASGSTSIGLNHISIISLWDIRKSGSFALLSILDYDNQSNNNADEYNISEQYQPNGSHWRTLNQQRLEQQQVQQHQHLLNQSSKQRININKKKDKKKIEMVKIAPNNYNTKYHSNSTATSHGNDSNGISSLQFHPSCGHNMLISTSISGKEMYIWDLRTAGHRMNRQPFLSVDGSRQICNNGIVNMPLCITEHYCCNTNNDNNNNNWIYPYHDNTMIWITKDSMIYGYSIEDFGSGVGGNNKPVCTLRGHLDTITSLTVMNDGTNRLISAANDGLILIWKKNKTKKQQQRHTNTMNHNSYNNDVNEHNLSRNENNNNKRSKMNNDGDIDSW